MRVLIVLGIAVAALFVGLLVALRDPKKNPHDDPGPGVVHSEREMVDASRPHATSSPAMRPTPAPLEGPDAGLVFLRPEILGRSKVPAGWNEAHVSELVEELRFAIERCVSPSGKAERVPIPFTLRRSMNGQVLAMLLRRNRQPWPWETPCVIGAFTAFAHSEEVPAGAPGSYAGEIRLEVTFELPGN